jgi:aromatic ring-opening dioxygenase catalytic subunit (LigB family)
MVSNRLPTLMIPHGGGPCFFMDPPSGHPRAWDAMAAYLRSLDREIGRRPNAVLVVSAHWECAVPTVQAASAHHLLFDYYGFPEHTYRLTYPVRGAPNVAERTCRLLKEAGIPSATELDRGLGHGVFVPFKLIYPDADVPVVQLSLRAGLSAQAHLEIGRALSPLRDENVLIAGSGMTFHALATHQRTDLAGLGTTICSLQDAFLIRWREATAWRARDDLRVGAICTVIRGQSWSFCSRRLGDFGHDALAG